MAKYKNDILQKEKTSAYELIGGKETMLKVTSLVFEKYNKNQEKTSDLTEKEKKDLVE
jgi:hypothetical protein